jgi:ankyrin repeat protein
LEYGLDVNTADKEGRTALSHAAEYGRLQVVKWLVDHGAEHKPDTEGRTPLDRAKSSWYGIWDVVKWLEGSGK